ncbi:serine hydrolase family protein [Xenorhabdus sp. DI]|uniref:RBBP9/YdeN family alpha/beta hydrolase n=1 Tax=Xenorhabdus doucetiae TaxID=351671 RepID=UPI0019C270C9|nr:MULTISPECIES: alpha/beta fold hydrolase [unclassified Xenorhabdus]MBD2785470.1 serine hydrolase family protein [Xenorhabdus sp. 3]MBD2788891.1 serine hydrolase family protein [Xenorhabdus sp. DI]MBD2795119.1 serine hydrolase family protein [Xenorhabdus sp. 18]
MASEKVSSSGQFSGKKIIIIHGYTASPSSNWFPWLKEKLTEQGAEVIVPAMPETSAPKPESWAKMLMDIVPVADKNSVFIGHSLGCIAVLRHLESICSQHLHIGGYILVSGFDSPQITVPELNAFTVEPLDYAFLRQITKQRISLISSNDQIVSPQSSLDLAHALQTEVINVANAGHFLDRDGFTRLSPVYDILQNMLSE